MGKVLILILIALFFCIANTNSKNNSTIKHGSLEMPQYHPLKYEEFKDSYWFKDWQRSEGYQTIYSTVSEQAKKLWPYDYERRQRGIKNYMHNYEEEWVSEINKKTLADYTKKMEEYTKKLEAKSLEEIQEEENKIATYSYNFEMGIPQDVYETIIKDYKSIKKSWFKDLSKYRIRKDEFLEKEIQKYKKFYAFVEANRNCGIPKEIYDGIVEGTKTLFVQEGLEEYIQEEIESYQFIYMSKKKLDIPKDVYERILYESQQMHKKYYSGQKEAINEKILKYQKSLNKK